MTSKERMMRALRREKPDRLPVTLHQWQPYHLKKFMGGRDQLETFLHVGLDAAVTHCVVSEQQSPDWVAGFETAPPDARGAVETRVTIETPGGTLTYKACSDATTTFLTEHVAKSFEDAELFLRYWPGPILDKKALSDYYDRTADNGIVRGFVSIAPCGQPGAWQEFVEMFGTQEAIFLAMDEPERVHSILDSITRRKVAYVHEQMADAKYDLIEHGGGAASSTVISPAMFEEFCLPYDRRVISALHEHGFPVVYHTCGGMMRILDKIPLNGCDASETLSPPGVGGDIRPDDRAAVKEVLGAKVGLVGGLDQANILSDGTPAQISREVRSLFETFGRDGGFICSAADHFFEAPLENLRALAQAGRECSY
jgi:Uroporphyrinogen decarboxylase (URO-D)